MEQYDLSADEFNGLAALDHYSKDIIEQCIELFKTFSSEDALKIFFYAENGIRSSKTAIDELKITPKRYYSRLKTLLDIGALQKDEGGYVYTPIGEVLKRLGLTLMELFNNQDRIELMTNLNKSDFLSIEEQSNLNKVIFDKVDFGKFLGPFFGADIDNSVEKITNYGDLVDRINQEMSTAEKSIHIATMYFEPSVMDPMVKIMKEGKIESKVMISKEVMSKTMTKLRILISPKVLMNIFDLMTSFKNISDIYREVSLPFSFCVIDDEKCFFEFPYLKDQDFSIAFFMIDRNITKRFKDYFIEIWSSSEAEEKPILFKNI